MILTVDRIEENMAVLLDKDEKTYSVPCSCFPFPLADGMTLRVLLADNTNEVLEAAVMENTETRQNIQRLMKKLFR